MTQLEMRALVDELNRASVLYYTRGDSPMSDAEWDQKYNQLLQMEKESGMVLPDSPSHRVGADPLKTFEQHKHLSRLWSMGKVQSKEELRWEKIADFLRTNSTIQNSDVQNFLDVSSATASRILNALTKEGKLIKVRNGRYWAYKAAE